MSGEDNFGNSYASVEEMWKFELRNDVNDEAFNKTFNIIGSKQNWYKSGLDYWNAKLFSVQEQMIRRC